jgi:EAL and modified HD-GYP domain-containing signal transduction protein
MNVYVARQPIFTGRKSIHGYELLFRDSMVNSMPDVDGNTATSRLLSNSFFTLDIESLVGGKKAFINFTEDHLCEKTPFLFPSDKITVEILEDVNSCEPVINACHDMVENGYEIALDDFLYKSELEPLVALASIIKVDFRSTPIEEVRKLVDELRPYRVKFLAEKVETHDEFQQALEIGFEYFQGYFFRKPEVVTGKDFSPSKLSLLQIMAEVNREDFTFEKLEELILRDVSISYKLLRYINSAYFRRLCEISSVRHAIALLGQRETKRFISFMAMADLAHDKPDELIRTSIIRAKLCELLGSKGSSRIDKSELFTLGLFSLIDAILDEDMKDIMDRLPLSARIKRALVDGAGILSDYVDLISSYEAGDWDGVSELVEKMKLDEDTIPEFYLSAVGWADHTIALS